jgi:predicted DNA-binding protein YlxM (UPF0122 family)
VYRAAPPRNIENRLPLHKIWPKEKLDEVLALLLDRDNTITEIAQTYGVSQQAIRTYAKHCGIPNRYEKGEERRATDPAQLSVVDKQMAQIAAKKAELEEELRKLAQVRSELSLHFENDGDYVLVYGVADTPLRASRSQWLQFLNLEGARKLRDFINAELAKAGAKTTPGI